MIDDSKQTFTAHEVRKLLALVQAEEPTPEIAQEESPILLTYGQVCKKLNISYYMFRRLEAERGLPVLRWGGRLRVDEQKLREWLDAQHEEGESNWQSARAGVRGASINARMANGYRR